MAGLFAISRHEDEGEDSAAFAATGKGRLRMAVASNIRNSATAPRKNGSSLWAAVQATISEQNTAPRPQKKFSRLTALAREPAPEHELDPVAISAIIRLSDGTTKPRPMPYAATESRPSESDPIYSVVTPHAINSSPERNAGRNPNRASRNPESCTPTS